MPPRFLPTAGRRMSLTVWIVFHAPLMAHVGLWMVGESPQSEAPREHLILRTYRYLKVTEAIGKQRGTGYMQNGHP